MMIPYIQERRSPVALIEWLLAGSILLAGWGSELRVSATPIVSDSPSTTFVNNGITSFIVDKSNGRLTSLKLASGRGGLELLGGGGSVYTEYEHTAAMADKSLVQTRMVMRGDANLFDHHSVTDTRFGVMPTPAELVAGTVVQDATIRLNPGTAYEAETGKDVYTCPFRQPYRFPVRHWRPSVLVKG